MTAGILPVDLDWVGRAEHLAASFARGAAELDQTANFPFDNVRRLHDVGLLTLRAPRRFGGAAATLAEAARVVGAIAGGEPATALVLAMNYIQHAGIARNPRWPEHLKERVFRDASAGVSLINALRVEPDLGTPARGGLPETIARRCGDGWRLSGRKIFSTGAPILSWYAVWARTDEAEPRVGTFLVPAGLLGTRIEETWDHLGLRASGSHDIVFDDVVLRSEHAVDIRSPAEWTSGDAQEMHLESGVLLSALYDGIARAAFGWLVDFLQTRTPTNLGRPLATLPRVEEAVGEAEMRMRTNARLITSLAADIDEGRAPPASDANAVKSVVTNNAVAVVETALSLTGNHGLSRHNPLQRHYRDVLCGRVHTPQDDAVKIMLGRAALA